LIRVCRIGRIAVEEVEAVTKAEILSDAPESGYQPVSQDGIAMPFQPGEIVAGKYEIGTLIGTGGMGYVVSATHIELGEKVALKFLRPECMSNEELVGRFAREARASVKIKSEYVARVFDVGNLPDGAPFIVMEYLEGKDLFEVVREQGPLTIKLAVEYVMQACEALAVAHASGVVHRDIKPENLFLTQRAQGMDIIKVLDFGISKVALTGSAFESKMPLVRTMMPMGSPVYMSPEQIRASQDIDARTDIWSLGCVLYELLTGSAAFDAPSLTQLSATILEQSAPPLRALCPNAPLELEAIVMRCLEKDPSRRFQDVGELAIALYPYAPRRARISAERCCYVLKSAGMSHAEFELPSVSPPNWSGPQSENAVVIPSDAVRTSAPASITRVDFAPPRKSSRSRWAVLAALSVIVAASGYAFWARRQTTAAAEGVPYAPAAVPSPVAAAPPTPAPAGAAETAANVVAPVLPSSVAVPAGKAPLATPPPARPRVAAPPPRPRPPATAKPAATGRDELDVGF
jgi:eukaryotic-like serine/threonine-protein kinase